MSMACVGYLPSKATVAVCMEPRSEGTSERGADYERGRKMYRAALVRHIVPARGVWKMAFNIGSVSTGLHTAHGALDTTMVAAAPLRSRAKDFDTGRDQEDPLGNYEHLVRGQGG